MQTANNQLWSNVTATSWETEQRRSSEEGRERKSKRQRGAQVAKTSPDEVDPIGWAFFPDIGLCAIMR